jgi:pimeloyl-ACP methyl ester carboxylesterase
MIASVDVERGTMATLPYFAVGAGRPLVVLGGLAPDTGVESDSSVRMNGSFVAPFARGRRVFFFNRRPGLPRGMTMAELAGEHADALRSGFGADAVDVLGISTGGSIAQQLAADQPGVVRRLVLVSTACRLGSAGRVLQRRVAARIRKGAHRQAFAVMAAGLVPPRRGRLAAATAAWLAAPGIAHSEEDLADMATTIEAEDEFDLASQRGRITAPTLIVVGGRDVFYDRELFEETARLIPDSRLRVHERRGHVTVTMRRGFGPEILEFLDEDQRSSRGA